MYVYIDESGSFVPTRRRGSWNCVAAYVSPENETPDLANALAVLRQESGISSSSEELKLRRVPERCYFAFLGALVPLQGVVFAAASDAGFQSEGEIRAHQRIQADKIEEHKDKMRFSSAREGLNEFAEQIRTISPQLYVQLYCHAYLVFSVINRGISYLAQRCPEQLGAVRWRIDQKDASDNVFEDSYLKLLLPLLQSMSLEMPSIMIRGVDYSHFSRFEYAEGEAPTYLSDVYRIETDHDPGINLGKLLREDFRFEDSRDNEGIQVADLVNSGFRRCLRGGFSNNRRAARLLGSLLVQDVTNRTPIDLLSFTQKRSVKTDRNASVYLNIMTNRSRRFLSRT